MWMTRLRARFPQTMNMLSFKRAQHMRKNTNEMYPVFNFWLVHINHQKSKLTANMIATSTYLKPAYFRQCRGLCFPLHVDGYMCLNCQIEIFYHTIFFDVPSRTTQRKRTRDTEEQHWTYFQNMFKICVLELEYFTCRGPSSCSNQHLKMFVFCPTHCRNFRNCSCDMILWILCFCRSSATRTTSHSLFILSLRCCSLSFNNNRISSTALETFSYSSNTLWSSSNTKKVEIKKKKTKTAHLSSCTIRAPEQLNNDVVWTYVLKPPLPMRNSSTYKRKPTTCNRWKNKINSQLRDLDLRLTWCPLESHDSICHQIKNVQNRHQILLSTQTPSECDSEQQSSLHSVLNFWWDWFFIFFENKLQCNCGSYAVDRVGTLWSLDGRRSKTRMTSYQSSGTGIELHLLRGINDHGWQRCMRQKKLSATHKNNAPLERKWLERLLERNFPNCQTDCSNLTNNGKIQTSSTRESDLLAPFVYVDGFCKEHSSCHPDLKLSKQSLHWTARAWDVNCRRSLSTSMPKCTSCPTIESFEWCQIAATVVALYLGLVLELRPANSWVSVSGFLPSMPAPAPRDVLAPHPARTNNFVGPRALLLALASCFAWPDASVLKPNMIMKWSTRCGDSQTKSSNIVPTPLISEWLRARKLSSDVWFWPRKINLAERAMMKSERYEVRQHPDIHILPLNHVHVFTKKRTTTILVASVQSRLVITNFAHEKLNRVRAHHENKTFSNMVVWFGGANGATSSLVVAEARWRNRRLANVNHCASHPLALTVGAHH